MMKYTDEEKRQAKIIQKGITDAFWNILFAVVCIGLAITYGEPIITFLMGILVIAWHFISNHFWTILFTGIVGLCMWKVLQAIYFPKI